MNIFIDIGHPAHVHYFKNFIKIMKSKGHKIMVTARDRYPVKELLDHDNIQFYNRGKGRNSVIGKLLYMVYADFFILSKALKFKPDIFLSFTGAYTTHAAKLMGKPSIVIDDTDSEILNRRFYKPFVSQILTPDVFALDLGEKHIKFKSYMELAYLHPKFFKPKRTGQEILGISKGEKYVIIRFVNWQANHDYGHNGISIENKINAVKEFRKYAKVFITSEKELPKEIEQYQIKINPNDMHEVLNSATLLFGESATMASECAVLGVPSIYIDDDGRSYTDEEEFRYGIVYNYDESDSEVENSIKKGLEILKSNQNYKTIKNKILAEKISLTDYLVWVFSNYPKSIITLKEDIVYQNKFINTETVESKSSINELIY